jgi:hypothetical protein
MLTPASYVQTKRGGKVNQILMTDNLDGELTQQNKRV